MCYYLTISFGREHAATVKSDFSKGFRLRENKNPFFEKNFGSNFVSYDVTDGHCSCSIFGDLAAEEIVDQTAKIIEKYRKKGWSENKIRRAVKNHDLKPERKTDSGIRKILAELFNEIGSYWLFAHMYKGMIDEEPLKAASFKELKIPELADKKMAVPEDVIIKIK